MKPPRDPAALVRLLWSLFCFAWLAGWGGSAAAHNLSYALVQVRLEADRTYSIDIHCHVPAYLMGAEQAHLTEDNARVFLAMPDAAINARAGRAAAALSGALSLRADERLVPNGEVRFPDAAVLKRDAAVPRSDPRPSAPIRITGELAAEADVIDIALPLELGSAVVVTTHADGSTSTQAVGNGERSGPLRIDGQPGWREGLAAFGRFVLSGFEHIIPLGLDHILFIAALALGAPRMGALVKLATVFTVAHSLTLALAAFDVVRAPPSIVEPLIALSIAAVAIENILNRDRPHAPRTAIVFAFGLLHGLGFAGVLKDVGLPAGQQIPALLGFNIGVEIGQLAVIAAVLAILAAVRKVPVLQARAVAVASLAIACVGVFWTVERVMTAAGATLA